MELVAVWIRAFELQLLQSCLDKSIDFPVLNQQHFICALFRAVVSALLSLPVLNTILAEKRIALLALPRIFNDSEADGA